MPETINLFAWQQSNDCNAISRAVILPYLILLSIQHSPRTRKAATEAAFTGVFAKESGLLGGLLAGRVEGAGVVDLGDLVIAEAQHLAQDLVGVLAEQRRTGDLAR